VTSVKVNYAFRGKCRFPISICTIAAAHACKNDDFLTMLVKFSQPIPKAYAMGTRRLGHGLIPKLMLVWEVYFKVRAASFYF
jgi:hypothetical protein